MRKYAFVVCLSALILAAGCAVPAQQGPNQGRMQKRSASGLMGAPQKPNQPPDAPPQQEQPPQKY